MCPMSIVALVFIPSSWATRMTRSQSSPAALAEADPPPHARVEDLAAAAGDRVASPGRVEPADDLPHVQAEEPLELDELRRAEGVDVDGRENSP